MMIYVLVLCGLALEAFRLSIAAGAIQANLTKRKIILLGGIFAAVQLVLFLLGIVCLWKWTDFLSVSENIDNIARIGSVIFTVLGFAMIFLGIREKRLEESCIHPWSVEGFAQYAFYTIKHFYLFSFSSPETSFTTSSKETVISDQWAFSTSSAEMGIPLSSHFISRNVSALA